MSTNDYGCIFATAGETITAAQVCYLSTGVGELTAGRAYLADADYQSRSTAATLIGVATAGAAAAAPVRLRLLGVQDGFTGLTAGDVQWVSATAGGITTDKPRNALSIGVAISATEISVSPSGAELPASLPDQAYWGGELDPVTDLIDRVTISTTAASTSHGTLSLARGAPACAGSATRLIWAGGYTAAAATSAVIDYQDPAVGTAVATFGTLILADYSNSGAANSTRALWMRGVSQIGDYVTDVELTEIASKGNSGLFSDLSGPNSHNHASAGNATHALTGGNEVITYSDDIIVNAYAVPDALQRQFGALTVGRERLGAVSTATRVFWCGGRNDAAANTNIIDSVVIATEASATDIGDLTRSDRGVAGSANTVRAVIGGGYTGSAYTDTIDYFAVTGSASDATDFGDLTTIRGYCGAQSTCHGGLQ